MDNDDANVEVQYRDDRIDRSDPLAAVGPDIRQMTLLDLDEVWAKIGAIKSIFPEPRPDDERFFKELMALRSTIAFIVQGGALVYLTDVEVRHHAYFHGVVWEPRLYRRHDLARRVIKLMFMLLQFHRLTAVVPVDNELAAQYLEALGFKFEGRLREFFNRQGSRVDAVYYGLLREEFDNGWLENTAISGRLEVDGAGGAGSAEGRHQGGTAAGVSGDASVSGLARPGWRKSVWRSISDWTARRAD
jgi:RimJ/RimL family protein N-acetyltransferase